MNESQNCGNKSKLGKFVTFAKFENLFGTVDEMYLNGSKQSFMTLNVQFMISQMMAILKESTIDFSDVHDDIKRQIEKHAKSFYVRYGNKEFYLIENQIGFIYCLMTLISKKMIKSSTGYEILRALSFVDNANSFKSRESVLDALKSDSKTKTSSPVMDESNLFAPDERTFNSLRSLIQDTQKVRKPIGPETLKTTKSEKLIPANLDRIILKQTPFDGSFQTYYKAITNAPTIEKEKEKNKQTIKNKESDSINTDVPTNKKGRVDVERKDNKSNLPEILDKK